jgi:hypothetical protein
MLAKIKIALAAGVLVFGAASVAQAGDNGPEQRTEGFHIGPLGQHLGGPFYPHSMRGGRAFGFVAPHRSRPRAWHFY